jgi:hypothetical protein
MSRISKASGEYFCRRVDIRIAGSNRIIQEDDIEVSCPRMRIPFEHQEFRQRVRSEL